MFIMSRAQFVLYLFGILVNVLSNNAQDDPLTVRHKRMIGGHNATENQFPYQVVLETYSVTFCGGSILSERFIITAAHCVVKRDGAFKNYPIKVIAGITDLKSKSSNKQIVDVAEVYVPKEYDPYAGDKFETGDIAILKLNKDLDMSVNRNLGKIELPMKNYIYDGVEATISGWGWSEIKIVKDHRTGFSEEKGQGPDQMRFAEADVVSMKDCQKSYALYKISKKHLCARVVQHDKKKREGVCSGDSGGPLVYGGIQIGVLSNNPRGCRENRRPAIYTRVSEFLDFIKKVVNNNTDDSIRMTKLRIRV